MQTKQASVSIGATFTPYIKAFTALTATVGTFFFAKSMGVLPGSWWGEDNQIESSSRDTNPSTALQKRESFVHAQSGFPSNIQLNSPVQEFTLTPSYDIHEKRALSNATQSSLIEGVEVGNLTLPAFPRHLVVSGSYAFVSTPSSILSLQIIDIANAAKPQFAGSYPTVGFLLQTKLSAQYAFAVAYTSGVEILNVTNVQNVSLVDAYVPLGGATAYMAEIINETIYAIVGNGVSNYILNGLSVVDIEQPNQNLWGAITYNLGGTVTHSSHFGDHLFLTNAELGLIITDVRAFFSPGYIDIPGNASGITVVNNILYIAGGGAGLQLFNVSEPSAPLLLGTYSTPQAIHVAVVDHIAYLAAGDAGLLIIDISNPSIPLLIGSYTTYRAIYVTISENVAYLADGIDLRIINVTNSAAPSLLFPLSGAYCPSSCQIFSIAIAGSHQAYLASDLIGITSMDITNPSSPSRQTFITSSPNDMAANQKILCTTNSVGLQIASANTVSERAFVLLGSISIPSANSVSLSGDFAYVSSNVGLHVVDVTNPINPILLATYTTPYNAIRVAATEKIAYLITESNIPGHSSVYTMRAPFFESRYPMLDSPLKVAVVNGYAFVAGVKSILHMINVQNPLVPQEIASYALSDTAVAMVVSGDFLYIAEQKSGIEVVDVSNPISPQLAGKIQKINMTPLALDVSNNEFLYVGDIGNNALIIFEIAEKLVVVNNQLSVNQGQIVNVTLADMSARSTRQIGFYPEIAFAVSSVVNGQFVFSNNSNQAITVFTQQDIIDGRVQFKHAGGQVPPSYLLSAIFGNLTTVPVNANVSFSKVYQMPVMGNNQLVIDEDETIRLSTANLNASVSNGDYLQLQFAVNSIRNGRFQLSNDSGTFITQFSQAQVINGEVEFVHVGGGRDKPAYQISVADGPLSTSFSSGVIDFDAAPQIVVNTLNINNGETITMTDKNLRAIDFDSNNATLLFDVSDISHGKFKSTKNSTTPVVLSSFIQQDIADGHIQFTHDGSGIAPSYIVSVSDGRINIANQNPTVLFNSGSSQNNTPAIVGSVLGFGALLAAGGIFAKRQIDQSTRKKHQFAAYIWEALKLQGIDNFKTDKGQKYVSVIETALIPELKNHGFDVGLMEDKELRDLAQNIARVAKSKITSNTTFFGYSEITADDLSRKVNDIVQGVLARNSFISDETDYKRLDDEVIDLTPKAYIPEF